MRLDSLSKKPRKLYAPFNVNMTDGGGASSSAKDFDYAQVEAALTSMENNITNIMTALSKKITVTSYQGDAQGEVESAVDSIRTYLATMEAPLNEMKAKIVEVKEAYASSEASIKSALSGIGGNIG